VRLTVRFCGAAGAALFALFVLVSAAYAQAVPRPEHPRPDLVRAGWQTLNGRWEFEFDDKDRGIAERWFEPGSKAFTRSIVVPYAFQSKMSGVADTSFHDVVWYRRTIEAPAGPGPDKRVLLNFGAVDYEATVWVNGDKVGWHRGGHVGFTLDVTDSVKAGANTLVVRAWDPSTDRALPRGKQYWHPQSEGIWYTRTTGIWQPVWLETASPAHVERLRITPDVDHSRVSVEAIAARHVPGMRLRVSARHGDRTPVTAEVTATGRRPVAILELNDQELWWPDRPALYDLAVELVSAEGRVLDRVESYFGQRKVSVHDGKVYINNAPFYLRMVLDQGYWPESLLTPPTDEAIQYDVKMTKAFGFNGARKHQKVADPRWLYWCDRLGLVVWGEMANAQDYNDEYVARFTDEWQQIVARDYNHPSIITWVPINESWGVPDIATRWAQQEHAKAMFHLLHSLDPTRLVIDNDGWEHTDETDIFGIHDYARTGEEMAAKYAVLETDRTTVPRNGREALAFGYAYNGSPIVMTEFGGISYRVGEQKTEKEWGYSGIEPTKEAFMKRLDGLVRALRSNKVIAGYCYTQLTDVEQEINGLMTYDRKPKADPKEFAEIFRR
jgi:beta-galactosidase/beta-glucuronidase